MWRRYLSTGGEIGELGLPTSNGIDLGDGWWGHTFELGSIRVWGSETRVDLGNGRVATEPTLLGEPVMNLNNADPAWSIRDLIEGYVVFGNKEWTRIDELTFDLSTGVVYCNFTIHAEHDWGKVLGQELAGGGEANGYFY